MNIFNNKLKGGNGNSMGYIGIIILFTIIIIIVLVSAICPTLELKQNNKQYNKRNKEGFVGTMINNGLNRGRSVSIAVDDNKINEIKNDFDKEFNPKIGELMDNSFIHKYIPKSEQSDYVEGGKDASIIGSATPAEFTDINKTSETAYRNGPLRKLMGEMMKNKNGMGCHTLPPTEDSKPGFAADNRFDNRMIPAIAPRLQTLQKCAENMTIDDKGDISTQQINAQETFCPGMSSNCRIAGSSMNITPLTGTCFKKFNTDKFFEDNTPYPPSLNVMEGEPETLKYKVNPNM